jgi:hypothetical protein
MSVRSSHSIRHLFPKWIMFIWPYIYMAIYIYDRRWFPNSHWCRNKSLAWRSSRWRRSHNTRFCLCFRGSLGAFTSHDSISKHECRITFVSVDLNIKIFLWEHAFVDNFLWKNHRWHFNSEKEKITFSIKSEPSKKDSLRKNTRKLRWTFLKIHPRENTGPV